MKIHKNIACAAAAMLALSVSIPASADQTLETSIRIEGIEKNAYFETVSASDINGDGKITAAEALITADEQSDKLSITGADSGYITEINGEKAGKFGGYDGWYYCVNGEAPSVGVNDYELKAGDSLTVYYGGFPCQIPYVSTEKLESDGVIVILSNDDEYDENWNATKVTNPVANASVTIGGEKYTTDDKGEIKLDVEKLDGEVSVQIEKKDETGAPCVLRFAPDFTIQLSDKSSDAPADSDSSTDEESTDTSSDSETDTDSNASTDSEEKSSDSDTSSDSSSKADSSSSQSSSSQSSSSSTTAAASSQSTAARSTTPAANTTAAVTSAQPANAAASTGDGRIYLALAVFGVAALVIIVMFVMGRLKKDK